MIIHCLKNNSSATLLFIAVLINTGCTTGQYYHSAKQYQINQCKQSASNAEYDDCIKRTEETYSEYNKKLEELKTK